MLKKSAFAVLGVLLLSGCSEVNSAIDHVDSAASKAQVCTEALGLANLNPNADPERLQAEAGEKAQQLRELGEKVADQSVRETVFAMADGYLELQQRQLDRLHGFDEWLERNLNHLDQLRQACL